MFFFTKGNDNQLCKRLHTEWNAHLVDWIRRSDGQTPYTCWVWPDDVNDWKYRRAELFLALFREIMKSENFRREDEHTFIELIVIYLSGIVLRPRKNHDPQSIVPYRLCRPIANNQTQIMEFGIHEMIIGLLKNQFRQDNERDDQSQAHLEPCAKY